MARIINLQQTAKIIVISRLEESIDTNKISIDSLIDNGESVIANISFFNNTGKTKSLTLWNNEDYVTIGEWTDEDVNNRILQLLNINN